MIAVLVVAGLVIATAGLAVILTQPGVRPRPVAAAVGVDPARLEERVRRLVEGFLPRDHAHPEVLAAAARDIASDLEAAGGRVREQPFASGRYRNVIAAFGPETAERIVIGAHYDTAGGLPGADDNASGVAVLVELGHLLGRNRPTMLVELVAYALEEPPFFRTRGMGSAVHAESLSRTRTRVRAMISLEMLGYYRSEPGSQAYPMPGLGWLYPSAGDFIAVVGRWRDVSLVRRIKAAMRGAAPLPVASINAPRWVPGVTLSDHVNFWNHGFPAVMVTDTAFLRNPNYHTAGDTPDTLDYDRLAMVVRQIRAAVEALQEPG